MNMLRYQLIISLIFIIVNLNAFSASPNIIELDISTNWTLQNVNKSITLSNLTIPINVHHALEDAKIISNILYGYNDVILRWIVYEPVWTFQKYFNLNQSLYDYITLNNANTQFEFYSLDTIASVYLNDKFLLFAQNEFLKYTIQNVSSKLQLGMNKLEIQFKSPVLYANESQLIYPYYVPPQCTDADQNGECHANFIRKQQCSFSWDWG